MTCGIMPQPSKAEKSRSDRSRTAFTQFAHKTATSSPPSAKAQPYNTKCWGCASNASHRPIRPEGRGQARSAPTGPGKRPELRFYRNTTFRLDPSPKAASGIVAAAALRPRFWRGIISAPSPGSRAAALVRKGCWESRGTRGALDAPIVPLAPPGRARHFK